MQGTQSFECMLLSKKLTQLARCTPVHRTAELTSPGREAPRIGSKELWVDWRRQTVRLGEVRTHGA
jgi:hypothetical protein